MRPGVRDCNSVYSAESEPEPAGRGLLIGKKFDSYKAAHDTHTAATEFLQDAAVRDSLADHSAFSR